VPEQLEPIWRQMRDELRRQTPDFKFHIWLEPLELAGMEGSRLFVRAPEHIRSWVGERYLPLLRSAAARALDERATVEIVSTDWSAPAETPAEPSSSRADHADSSLNPKYTFEQFVIGGGNRFAHAAALAVAEMPAQAYNPLFLHGPPGLGKTHLLHAIGNFVSRYGAGLRVRYATVERFTSAFVEAVRGDRMSDFKDSYRQVDVVLIDDVQFLASKERTREEFFHTFNALLDSGRQLVMTSDRCPEDLAELELRLTERFRSGLVVELEPPSLEVRRAILEKRARLDGVTVSREVLNEIARHVSSSVRALEGALIRVVAYASLRNEPITVELAARVLHRLEPPGSRVSVEQIAAAVGGRLEDLRAQDRRPHVNASRQLVMYLARELGHSHGEIAAGLRRDRSTVDSGIKRIEGKLRVDTDLRTRVDNLRSELGPRS
jgi:chromosomal replication initiator protein